MNTSLHKVYRDTDLLSISFECKAEIIRTFFILISVCIFRLRFSTMPKQKEHRALVFNKKVRGVLLDDILLSAFPALAVTTTDAGKKSYNQAEGTSGAFPLLGEGFVVVSAVVSEVCGFNGMFTSFSRITRFVTGLISATNC